MHALHVGVQPQMGEALTSLEAEATYDFTETGADAISLMRHVIYDIVVLDLELSDMDGYDVVRRMRVGQIDAPVVILSAVARPRAKVLTFALGADDFITKPFDLTELGARIQAVVRRNKRLDKRCLQIGRLMLDLDSREVTVEGRVIPLTGKEYAILERLMLRKGMVLTKEVLMNHLYGGRNEPEMRVIDVFVCKLRKKLAQAVDDNPISTVWGRGYTIREAAPAGVISAIVPGGRRQLAAA